MESVISTTAFCLIVSTALATDRLVPDQYQTIQAAIDDRNDGDTVIVAAGIYTGDGNRDIDFRGKPIIVQSENGPETCIIDCEATKTDRHRGFYFHSDEDAECILHGFTITNGYAWDGAGVYCHESGPSITNCIIANNVDSSLSGLNLQAVIPAKAGIQILKKWIPHQSLP